MENIDLNIIYTLPGQKKRHNFDLNHQIVALWSGFASVGQV